MDTLYCACCGQPFRRTSPRGPAPLYCSRDCRRQIEVRRRVWAAMGGISGTPSVGVPVLEPMRSAWALEHGRHDGGGRATA
ncbi:hypothetical protein [Azospirillum rugosum]|uniref:Uncharacterized protein n=1 Tax=Azospirillum rugosum TaxID=416170 RepID=A0ABS4SKF2_9PROT|nr:hypothetical protein [Azospirillum rugosum]MBP2293036.1 hypothetical protein [Azospirillum rugosum]MDQ0526585.1 hypothetical protein [Azospirillum rugosum]